MMIIQITLYLICIIYIAFVVSFIFGWKKIKPFFTKKHTTEESLLISLIIPFRNESSHLSALLKNISQQTYPNFEIILINDHSTDGYPESLKNTSFDKTFTLIDAVGEGKKNAIKEGIEKAKGELIVCTDADCLPHKKWLSTMAAYYLETQAEMIIAPVVIIPKAKAWEQFQALEFMSLQASTAGAVGTNRPIMCNGANLAFQKITWSRYENKLENDILSGDDMFLMLNVKKNGGKIVYLKSFDATVATFVSKNLIEFFNQRKRWVSKGSRYKDFDTIICGLSVLGVSMAIIISVLIALFVDKSFWITFGLIFISKITVDRILLNKFASFFKLSNLLNWMFPLSLIYPFYIIFTFLGSITSSFDWKNRKG